MGQWPEVAGTIIAFKALEQRGGCCAVFIVPHLNIVTSVPNSAEIC